MDTVVANEREPGWTMSPYSGELKAIKSMVSEARIARAVLLRNCMPDICKTSTSPDARNVIVAAPFRKRMA